MPRKLVADVWGLRGRGSGGGGGTRDGRIGEGERVEARNRGLLGALVGPADEVVCAREQRTGTGEPGEQEGSLKINRGRQSKRAVDEKSNAPSNACDCAALCTSC